MWLTHWFIAKGMLQGNSDSMALEGQKEAAAISMLGLWSTTVDAAETALHRATRQTSEAQVHGYQPDAPTWTGPLLQDTTEEWAAALLAKEQTQNLPNGITITPAIFLSLGLNSPIIHRALEKDENREKTCLRPRVGRPIYTRAPRYGGLEISPSKRRKSKKCENFDFSFPPEATDGFFFRAQMSQRLLHTK